MGLPSCGTCLLAAPWLGPPAHLRFNTCIGSPGVAVREHTALASSHLLRKKCEACSHPCCKAWLPSEPQARQWPSRRQ